MSGVSIDRKDAVELPHEPVPLLDSPERDEELLRRTAGGDRESFSQLVQAHQHRVVQLASRLLSPEQAEDVAQDAFIRVYRAAGSFKPQAKFTTWLYRIVVNLCHDQRRKWKLRLSSTEDIDPAAPTEASAVETDEMIGRVHAAMDQLPDRQRAALTLYRFEGLSYREVAAAMELSESAVESLIVRAYARLREELRDLKP
jgi:RNA polymerase sigma-70 factor (ECF subfamily)